MSGHELTRNEVGAIELQFSEFAVSICVDPASDSLTCIRNGRHPPNSEFRHPIAARFWAPLMGQTLTDAWQMVNHRGYWDSLQLEFRDSPEAIRRTIVQLYAEGSQISLLELGVMRSESSVVET
jgi:hypothetical protein